MRRSWRALLLAVAARAVPALADEADLAGLHVLGAEYQGVRWCVPRNGWCGGADLDRTGHLDELDLAFLEAAIGCRIDR